MTGSKIDEALEEARRFLPRRPTAGELPLLRARGALIVDIRPSEQRARDGELRERSSWTATCSNGGSTPRPHTA